MAANTSIVALFLLCVVVLSAPLPPQTPIIGVYTEDAEDFGQQTYENQTYIAASYVKNIEMTGAQVLPLFYHYPKDKMLDTLSKINGVMFPGG